jgi:hypothetical protein
MPKDIQLARRIRGTYVCWLLTGFFKPVNMKWGAYLFLYLRSFLLYHIFLFVDAILQVNAPKPCLCAWSCADSCS